MIWFERSTDWQLIKQIMTHPKVYPHVSDDASPAPEDWQPFKDEWVWWVIVRDEGEVLGLWMLHPHNSICWEIHTCLLPNAYGARARAAVKELAPWVWSNTPAHRITTEVPEYNRLARQFALMAGMKEYGVNPQAFMKNKQLHDVILLGTSRPEAIPCQQQL